MVQHGTACIYIEYMYHVYSTEKTTDTSRHNVDMANIGENSFHGARSRIRNRGVLKRRDIRLEQHPRAEGGLLVCTSQLERQCHATLALVTLKHHTAVIHMAGTFLCARMLLFLIWSPNRGLFLRATF